MAVVLKACPRCGGDLVADRWEVVEGALICLQCGRSLRVVPVAHTPAALPLEELPRLKKAC